MRRAWKQLNTLPRRAWLTLLLLVLTAVLYSEFSLSLSVWNDLRWDGTLPLFLLNLLPVLLLLLVLWLATGQAWLSVLVTGVLLWYLSAGNYFKLQFRDTPLEWADLYHIREGLQMSHQYNVVYTPVMWVWIFAIAALTVICFLLGRGKPGALVRLLGLTASGIALLACFYNIYPDNGLYADMAGDHGATRTEAYVSCGVVYPFLHSAGEYLGASWQYNEAEAARTMAQYTDWTIPEEKKVNLIGIQMEAIADFSKFDLPGLDPLAYSEFKDLRSRGYYGTLITDIFGGGTTETEWAVLTGGNRHDEFKVKTDSVAWYLKGQGYTANGSHPCRDWFYDRKHVNPNLGLDDYLFTDNYYYQFIEKDADVAYDRVFFPDLQDRLTAYFDSTDQPLFSFNVTYQGHGPYETAFRYWDQTYFTGHYSSGCLNAMNNYLWVVRDSMIFLTRFVNYLDSIDEPVVLFLYADHMPWMGNGAAFYKEMGINLDTTTEEGFRNYYSTWYLFWANDAAKEMLDCDFTGEGPDLSPCFLLDHLFQMMGWEGSDYMQAQREVADAVPVLHLTGWNEEAGGQLRSEVSAKVRLCQVQFQTLSTWDRHRYDKEGSISPEETAQTPPS